MPWITLEIILLKYSKEKVKNITTTMFGILETNTSKLFWIEVIQKLKNSKPKTLNLI